MMKRIDTGRLHTMEDTHLSNSQEFADDQAPAPNILPRICWFPKAQTKRFSD